jgi:hypothetical protein
MSDININSNNVVPADNRHRRPEDRFPPEHRFWLLSGRSQSILADIYGTKYMLSIELNNKRREKLIKSINKMIEELPENERDLVLQ